MEERQRLFFWTGEKPENAEGCAAKGEGIPFLSAATPLKQAIIVVFYWGQVRFEVVVTACSLRATPWDGEEITWLFCNAMPSSEVKPERTGMKLALIPAHYVTEIKPGPAFQIVSSNRSLDVGVFSPIHAAPVNPVAVSQIESLLAELVAPEMN